ncbi:SET domain-containing protein [Westerdykella ornata]|uniref:SET domain-containing protein n=1 Tax=Westerdykella ornata TaxID=318751 RepID=A0A6A6JHR8_WESOR|nr:SET domain-containing protein [Westerdykella ornata]KAF2276200.1 SET domain-containing protein [Westerdykella ornata]
MSSTAWVSRVEVRAGESRVRADKVHSILANRLKHGDEQYLVRWITKSSTPNPPLSWHYIWELSRCLEQVQVYLDSREEALGNLPPQEHPSKRKSPDSGDADSERHPSPFGRRLNDGSRESSSSRSSSLVPLTGATRSLGIEIYNGVIKSEYNIIYGKAASAPDIPKLELSRVPTPWMLQESWSSKVDVAARMIRTEYVRRLAKVPGPPIHLVNIYDSTTPSLRFKYITEYVYGEGVVRADPGSQVGCQKCSPSMSRNIGCEYTQKCDCLEFADVDEKRLREDQRALYEKVMAEGGSTVGFPKKFPYYTQDTTTHKPGTLVGFYLHSRRMIYECNDKCKCGNYCRNKNVQFGRRKEVEIFKTPDGRGWGLRCKEDLVEGEFIDTYRGEVITDAEATRRERSASKAKASYLYELDKFADDNIDPSRICVVDGEFMGGPTKFINHSCEPNCRQYTVSYNKFDIYIYDIALFACRDIPAGEELTFDYMDREEEEGDSKTPEPGEGGVPCLCGAKKCRKWLWT